MGSVIASFQHEGHGYEAASEGERVPRILTLLASSSL